MPSRDLDFPVFDADNHMYETPEAFTQFLPAEYEGLIKYVEVNGRTKIAVNNRISDYIPNPTFERVAAPGAQEEFFKVGNPEGKSRREILGKGMRALPGFKDPEPRLQLMDELGLDRALMWPTLASLLEERLRDNPPATHAVVHALNQWMHEHWSFNYEDRMFPTPVITLCIVDEAIKELEWVLDHGARIILIRPAPVPGFMGPRSMALPEFDPFWAKVAEADILVGMHSSDSGYQRYTNEWEGIRDGEMLPFKGVSGFQAITGHQGRPIIDTVASLVGHGLCRASRRCASPRWRTAATGSARCWPTWSTPGSRAPTPSTSTPLRCSSGTSTCTPSTRRTPRASSSCWAPTACCLAPTTPTPRACPIPSPSWTTSKVCPTRTCSWSWGAT